MSTPIMTDHYMMTVVDGVGVIETRCTGPRNTLHVAPLTWMAASLMGMGPKSFLITWLELNGAVTKARAFSPGGGQPRMSLCIDFQGKSTQEEIARWIADRLQCPGLIAQAFSLGLLEYYEKVVDK